MITIAELNIRNFALLEKAKLKIGPGLNVITGETGAGKSILVGALSMVLGEWVNSEIVRSGSESCEVEAVFNSAAGKKIANFLSKKELNDENLVIRRKFYIKGRSKCYINDRSVTLSTLRELGNLLVDIHSQNQHQSILRKSKQMEILDIYASAGRVLKEIKELWRKFVELKEARNKKNEDQKQVEEEIERLRFEIAEIDSVPLRPSLDEELESDYKKLSNIEKLRSAINELYGTLYEDDGAVLDKLSRASDNLTEIVAIDSGLLAVKESIERAIFELEAGCESIRSYVSDEDFAADRLDDILELRQKLNQLKRKYAPDIEGILKYRSQVAERIGEFENFSDIIAHVTDDIEKIEKRINLLIAKLSKLRKSATIKLSAAVNKGLKNLGMRGSNFKVKLVKKEIGPTGGENVEFHIRTNPGGRDMELQKVASGGEVSRIMLALKAALASSDDIPILIFDEIDIGIGATIAEPVGEELKKLSKYHQIISITHLKQIAAKADVHIKVEKVSSAGTTKTIILHLNKQGRAKEIARMCGA